MTSFYFIDPSTTATTTTTTTTSIMASPIPAPLADTAEDSFYLQLLLESSMPFASVQVPSLYSTTTTSPHQDMSSSIYSQSSDLDHLDYFLSGPNSVMASPIASPSLTSINPMHFVQQWQQQQQQTQQLPSPQFHALSDVAAASTILHHPLLSTPERFQESQQQQQQQPIAAPSFTSMDLLSESQEPGMDDILEAMKTPTPVNLLLKRTVAKNEHTDKPMRFRPTDQEYAMLVSIFTKNQFPSRLLREKIAAHLGLNMRQVQLWFQNRRASLKGSGLSFQRPVKGGKRV
ncbi:hypothetical protein CcCBS67573_g10038 [Chytriomyces confervae]|uniref:Homeobox domain-containing protein n=1 Tax=Chytriomyces confervae TaxID=246404 RepID=A0A507DJB1_9FUNG|nr:hypothetical protein CcCBS67573_g10038 [Chytriomyces confervae]